MKTYTYSDSVAGAQKETFNSLSEIANHIESFGWYGDSTGIIYQSGVEVIKYISTESELIWEKI